MYAFNILLYNQHQKVHAHAEAWHTVTCMHAQIHMHGLARFKMHNDAHTNMHHTEGGADIKNLAECDTFTV